jgi:hypothetical protein
VDGKEKPPLLVDVSQRVGYLDDRPNQKLGWSEPNRRLCNAGLPEERGKEELHPIPASPAALELPRPMVASSMGWTTFAPLSQMTPKEGDWTTFEPLSQTAPKEGNWTTFEPRSPIALKQKDWTTFEPLSLIAPKEGNWTTFEPLSQMAPKVCPYGDLEPRPLAGPG